MELRFFKICSAKADMVKRRPTLRFNGDWLANSGFEPDTLVTAQFSNGEAVFRPHDPGRESTQSVLAKTDQIGFKLLRVISCVSKGKRRPVLNISGYWLNDFGFVVGGVIVVMAGTGLIKVKVLDTGPFGF